MLLRSLGPVQIQLISLGGIIGSAYFLGAGTTLAENGPWAILAFSIGGLIVWLVAMAMGELSVAMPREGSFVSHSRELLGRPWAAGVGWSYWFNWCAYIPSEMLAGGMILHQFFPWMPVMGWAALFGAAITGVNLMHVRYFGHIESALSLLKIAAIALFTALGAAIWMGWAGAPPPMPASAPVQSPAPFAFLATMVLVLVNFQGTELIALSAAETRDPERSIPRAARNVAVRSIALYVLPIVVLVGIFPWNEAQVERSVFVEALALRGFGGVATFLQIVIVSAALSCANSGLYGAVRSLYGLAKEGLAPAWFGATNPRGVPARATWATILMSWSFLPLFVFFEGSAFYTWLLSVSGLTGAICWISISWCQVRFRRAWTSGAGRRGGSDASARDLPYRMPGYPYLSYLSVGLQTVCLGLVALHPTLRTSLILGVPAFAVPAMVCWARDRRRGPRR